MIQTNNADGKRTASFSSGRSLARLVDRLAHTGASETVTTPRSSASTNGPGASEGICFLHGWLISPNIWAEPLAAVARRGWRAVALAQPAHGQALPPSGVLSMEAWADQTIAQLQTLGLEQCVFVGHSMGGMLALTIASRHPDTVLGLGLVGTTDEPSTAEPSDSFMSLTARVSDHWSEETAGLISGMLLGKAFLQAHPAFLGEWTDAVSRYALQDMQAIGRVVVGRPDNTQVAAQLAVPTVVIHGEDDAAIRIETGVQLANRIPHATLVRLPAVGHCPPAGGAVRSDRRSSPAGRDVPLCQFLNR